jgi:hypothetical protein
VRLRRRLPSDNYNMTYVFEDNRQYIMPTHFGPMCGPRHTPTGGTFPQPDARAITIVETGFRTAPEHLKQLLPPGFELFDAPLVRITLVQMHNIAWLAGRGYNTLGVTVPVRFTGDRDRAEGPLQLVLWENLPDAILTGRDQLGFSKLYCELPPFERHASRLAATASWMGHRFFDLTIEELRPADPPEVTAAAAHPTDIPRMGILNLRYLPYIDDSTRPRLTEATLVPFLRETPAKVIERLTGRGSLRFCATRWEDMPTQFRIVETLRALPMLEVLPAVLVRGIGACDARDQMSLR